MNTHIFIVISVVAAFVSLYAIFSVRGFPGSIQDIGWKISGIWENGSQTIQILINSNGPAVRGHVVWANEDEQTEKGKLVGSLILKEVKLRSFWRWSAGVYIDPVTHKEFPLRLRMRNNKSLTVHFFEDKGGELLIKEEWQLINPLL